MLDIQKKGQEYLWRNAGINHLFGFMQQGLLFTPVVQQKKRLQAILTTQVSLALILQLEMSQSWQQKENNLQSRLDTHHQGEDENTLVSEQKCCD